MGSNRSVSASLRTESEPPKVEGSSSLQENNTSFFKTFFNCVNAILGNGVLLVPYALASGGWLSIILLFIIIIAATYTGVLTKRCIEVNSMIKSYFDIGKYAFGRTGEVCISTILYIDLYIATTGILILEADNLHNLFPQVAIRCLGISVGGKSSFIIFTALVLLPSVMLDNFNIVAYISASGVLASVLLLGSIFWVGAFDGIGFHQHGNLFNWKGIPTAASLYMLCYSAHPVLPALYISMEKKEKFSSVLLLSFTFATLIFLPMAVVGYMMFGPVVETEITLSLPTSRMTSKIAIYTVLVTPLAKYALILKPIVISVESRFRASYAKTILFRLIMRTAIVFTQVVVALTLPFFAYLMSFSGALICATVSLTIPCLCYLKITSNTAVKLGLERILIWGIVFLSVLIIIFGTFASVKDIVVKIMKK